MGALMFQGTGSDVGKSVLVAGLCRLFTNRGLRVLPFKPQNMSNNAAVTQDGGEIGRAQALQAQACRALPHTDMNPVLLKPQSDRTSQLIVQGKVQGKWNASDFSSRRLSLEPKVLESYYRLKSQADLVLIEGAGSPTEINLRANDIANMGFAQATQTPVVLIGDIDRGGVIASLIGTKTVISAADERLIKGFIINKFRGDPNLFQDGYAEIERRSGWKGFGIVPWLSSTADLPSEDAVSLRNGINETKSGRVKIVCPILPHIANFDDLDPFKSEPDVTLCLVPQGKTLPLDADLIILPGSKATIADLKALREQGWDIDILAHYRRGGHILGICGGYQMLGETISDPNGIEGSTLCANGLGLLPVQTELQKAKVLRQVTGTALGASFTGYEMHMGITAIPNGLQPFACMDHGQNDGGISADQRVLGSYVHGALANGPLRAVLLKQLGGQSDGLFHHSKVDQALDDIAAELEQYLDIDALLALASGGA